MCVVLYLHVSQEGMFKDRNAVMIAVDKRDTELLKVFVSWGELIHGIVAVDCTVILCVIAHHRRLHSARVWTQRWRSVLH